VAPTDSTISLVKPGDRTGDPEAAPQLVRLLQCDDPAVPPARHLLAGVDLVEIRRAAAREAIRGQRGGLARLELRLADRGASSEHARLLRVQRSWAIEDAGSKNGTLVNGAVVTRATLADGDLVQIGNTFLLFRDGAAPVAGDPDLEAPALGAPAPALATFSAVLAARFAALARVAGADLPVLLRGPSGSGKEVAARALHELSGRRGPYVAVNCGALPPTLVEAELFGHKRGAFSGALDERVGHVRAAHGGTLFLDEIADLPAAGQVALLRVLQEREVVPLGESRPVAVDVRLAAATNRDLEAMAAAGSFRPELAARLRGLIVELPPLRERPEDLGLLVRALLARRAPRATLTPAAATALLRHDWPDNVRELDMALSLATALGGTAIDVGHLPEGLRPLASADAAPADPLTDEDRALRDQLAAELQRQKGNVSAVARALGKGREQIHRWMRRFGMDPERYRD
jgi:hypothetical protein